MTTPAATPTPGNGTTPRVRATSLPVNPSPAPVEGALPPAPEAAVQPSDKPRRGRPRRAVTAPEPAPAAVQDALTDAHLLDLGRLHVLAAKAELAPQEFVEDCRLLVVAWDRFQASLGK